MKQQLYFDRHSGLQISALVEDGKLLELGVENEARRDIVGNIYKGRVVNVIESMNAAFVNCGLEKNCYLSLSSAETFADPSRYTAMAGGGASAPLRVAAGDEIAVQVLKNPRGQKGAKVTTRLSFVGKNLIYLPETDFLGISRKISEPELKENLLFTVDGMRKKNEGMIIRTIAPYATAAKLRAEVDYLKNLYAAVREKSRSAKTGDLLYREVDLPVRVLRDSFNDDVESITVGEKGLYDDLVALLRLRQDFDPARIRLYTGRKDMFAQEGLFDQIRDLSESGVQLDSGVNLVIERTEAMTVIDVNTGRFVGDENLEDTVYGANIAAAREIARQVRLRDVSGIVVVDFIDMANERHKQAVTEELRQCLSRDRVRCNVLPMNEFCLVSFTRKRTTNGVASHLLQPCPHCRRNGYVLSNEFLICRLRAEILEHLSAGEKEIVAELNDGLMRFLLAGGFLKKDLKNRIGGGDGKVFLVPHRTWHEERCAVSPLRERKEPLPPDAVTIEV